MSNKETIALKPRAEGKSEELLVDQYWNEFTKNGWPVDNVPDKKECFKEGWKAAIDMVQSQCRWVIDKDAELPVVDITPGSLRHVRAHKIKEVKK